MDPEPKPPSPDTKVPPHSGNGHDLAVAKKDGEDEKIVVIPPPPPAPPGTNPNVQLAVGMQFVQQSALGFDKLTPEVQHKMLDLVGQMDKHAFEAAKQSAEHDHDETKCDIEDRGRARKGFLLVVGLLAGACLIAGTAVTWLLITKDKPELAHTVMMSGMAVIAALLGGAGLASIAKTFGMGGKSD